MYLNTFKYTPAMVDCRLCTEYRKPRCCTVSGSCPWLAERIEAGVVGYTEALLESFSENKRLAARLHMAVQLFSGSLWLDKQSPSAASGNLGEYRRDVRLRLHAVYSGKEYCGGQY